MPRAVSLLPVLLLPLLLVACGAPGSSVPRFESPTLFQARPGNPNTNPAVVEACRQQAAQQIQRQDRGQLLREDESQSRLGAGFAGTPATNQSDRLGRQFQFDRRIDECVRANTQTGVTAPTPTPSPEPAPAPARTRRGTLTGGR